MDVIDKLIDTVIISQTNGLIRAQYLKNIFLILQCEAKG